MTNSKKRRSSYLVICFSIVFLCITFYLYPLFYRRLKDTSTVIIESRTKSISQIYLNYVHRKDVFISLHRQRMLRHNISHSVCEQSVTLVTQTHYGNLHLLEAIVDRWNGPISVSVFIDHVDDKLVQQVQYFYECFPKIKSNTSFHLVYPRKLDLTFTTQNCTSRKSWYEATRTYGTSVVTGVKYPHNYMRNVALPEENEGFIMYIDIDVVPSVNVLDDFLRLKRNLSKYTLESSLFIVPSFETSVINNVPKNITGLLKDLDSGRTQIFHKETCDHCQKDTMYDHWLSLNSTNITSYEVNRTHCAYEPFFIIHSKMNIMYDERFIGRGYDRISQVSELWMAGMQFRVMSNSFLVHRGYHEAPLTFTHQKQDVYKERHLQFCRAKYIEYKQFNGELQTLCGEKCVLYLERKLLMHNFQTEAALKRERDRISWLSDLENNEMAQYKWYLKFGDMGFLMKEISSNGSSAETESSIGEDVYLSTDEAFDPNRLTFLRFTLEKWKLYKNNERKFCII